MAQTGYTPILIYSSTTASQAPSAGNLTNNTLGSELAINITDGKLFYKDNANAIQVIGWKTTPTSAGGTGLTSYTAGDLLYYASGTTLSKLAIGASTTILTSSGSAPQWSAASGITVGTATNIAGGAAGSVPYQTGAGATSLLAIGTAYYQLGVNAGGTAPAWQPSATSVLTAQGDLLYASAANTLARLAKNTTATRYLSNAGSSNNPAWAQIDLSNGVTGTLPVGNGGTGLTAVSAGYIPFGNTATALTTSGDLTFASNVLEVYSTVSARSAAGNASLRLRSNASYFEWLARAGTNNLVMYDGGTGFDLLTLNATTYDFTINRGNQIFSAAKGVNFTGNSAAAGKTSQLLNWYEEGTFTCGMAASTSGTITLNASYRTGRYTRIGRQVTVCGFLVVSSVSSPVGSLTITGLPYANGSNDSNLSAFPVYATGLDATATTSLIGRIGSGATALEIALFAAGSSSNAAGKVLADAQFTFMATYFVS